MPLSRAELSTIVRNCANVWRTKLVDFRDQAHRYAFQDAWDFADKPQLKEPLLRELAIAGAKLFLQIFSPKLGEPKEKAALANIGIALRKHMATQPTWIRVTSDGFFAPWNLIYSESLELDGSNVRPEGFWGYQHVIEHVPDNAAQGIELQSTTPLNFALQLDQRIDQELNVPCNSVVTDFLGKYAPAVLAQSNHDYKKQLLVALRDGELNEHILYFCCHAAQEATGDYMTLSDPREKPENRITPDEVIFSLDMKSFQQNPVVFLNACGAAQINSIFYEGFATVFLAKSASAVLGPQTDVPAIFAGEFARRFFERFFVGGPQRSIGKVLHELRREFLDKHHNPMAMLYALYRGGDVHLRQPLPGRVASIQQS